MYNLTSILVLIFYSAFFLWNGVSVIISIRESKEDALDDVHYNNLKFAKINKGLMLFKKFKEFFY